MQTLMLTYKSFMLWFFYFLVLSMRKEGLGLLPPQKKEIK